MSLILMSLILALLLPALVAAPPVPDRLRTEYLENPLGLDTPRPRFFWILRDTRRGGGQTGYQIQVSAGAGFRDDAVWDSGRVASPQFTHVEYGGPPLASGRSYFWRVRYWDMQGSASSYSKAARFDTGLLDKTDWKASWIAGGNEFRHEFMLAAAPARARAYVCGLGWYELRVNGARTGDRVLDPAWTTYSKRALYSVYDVTGQLREGANAVGVLVGKGRAERRALLVQIHVESAEGGRQIIVSGPDWQTRDGSIVFDDIYDGETYDARLEQAGWRAASVIAPPARLLAAQAMQPVRVTDTILPATVNSPRAGVHVFDFGRVFSGWVRLSVRGPRGAEVRLRHAELLYPDGTINTENLRKAKAEDAYILNGEGDEVYEPRFTYHGFRYVEVTGYPGVPPPAAIVARVVRSDVTATGAFACSNDLLNRLQEAIHWTQKTNLHGLPTDNNQRDERLGWLGDAHVTMEEASLNFDMAALYTKYLRDIADAQSAEGALPDTVPFASGRADGDPAWGSAYPLLVWNLYRYYGDRRVVEEHYEGARRFVEHLRATAGAGLLKTSYYGDWVALESTPGPMVSSFYYILGTEAIARMALLLGRAEDERAYNGRARKLRDEFHEAYYSGANGWYGTGSQTSQVLALALGLSGPGAAERLVNSILVERSGHLSTGIIGTKFLLPVLEAVGRADIACELLEQRTYPSWGYMLDRGATGLWETWQHRTGRRMNSWNQPMLGAAGAWLYEGLAGIRPAEDGAGWERILIAPQVTCGLNHAAASIATVRGTVSSAWERSRTRRTLRLEVVIPAGSEALLRVPRLDYRDIAIHEGATPVWRQENFLAGAPGVRWGRGTGAMVEFGIASGHYVFELRGER